MFSLNRVEVIGYQTQPVQLRKTPGGTSVTDLNVVVPYTIRSDNGELIQGKSFHTVTIWGAMADVAGQYVRPGSQLYVSGRLQTDSWDDTQSGEKRSKTKIVAMDLIMLDPKNGQMDPPDAQSIVVNGSVNRAQAIGNITRDPEIRTTTSGKHVMSFGVATNERWKDKASGETKERSEFHNIVAWAELAQEVQKFIKKGNRVYVSGRVQTRSWETQTGQKRTTTEIIADQVLLLGVKNAQALSSVQSDSLTPSRQEESEAPQGTPVGAMSQVEVPAIQYESVIKPEDLPF